MTRRIARIVCALRVLCGSTVVLAGANAHALQPAPPRWKGTIDLTIGGENAANGADFGQIAGLAVDAAGRIFVADAQDSQVKVFSPAGALLARIGRSGSGPLEFKRLATIVIGPDRMLWVRDEGNARMLVIDVSKVPAVHSRTVPLSQFSGGSRVPITFDPSGALIDETFYFDKGTSIIRPLRVRRGLTGGVQRVDTIALPEGAYAGVHMITREQKDAAGKVIGMSQGYMWQPHGPLWHRAYGPGGTRADAVGSRYEARVFGPDGHLLRTIKRSVPPVPLSPNERRVADSTIKAQKTALPFGVPSAKPPIIGMAFSLDGRLWIERSVADGRPREADVFDADGRLVAIAEWPAHIDLMAGFPVIQGTTAHVVGKDAMDLERVVRVRFR